MICHHVAFNSKPPVQFNKLYLYTITWRALPLVKLGNALGFIAFVLLIKMMGSRLEVTIPVYRDRIYSSFMRKRVITVRFKQEYAVNIALYTGELYTIHKRYSEFLDFRNALTKLTRKLRLILPRFPPKVLRSSKIKVKEQRKDMLETWISCCFSFNELLPNLVDFLQLPEFFHMILTEPNKNLLVIREAGEKLNELEYLIQRFAELIITSQSERLDSLVYAFTHDFFSKPQKIRPAIISLLLRFLIELVRDEFLTYKALKFVNRLCCRNFFSGETYVGHAQVIEELMKFDIELLAEMKLNLFIQSSDDHIKAETLRFLTTLKENLSRDQRSKLLVEIVKDN